MRSFLSAVQFLTILRLPGRFSPGDDALHGAPPYFPVVGLLIGIVVAAIDRAFGYFVPVSVGSVLAVILLVAASGGLHIDGLADTADGLFSSRPREKMLEIMRDSRTGPMGVLAIVCVVSLKIALLSSLNVLDRFWTLLLIPTAGRAALVFVMALLPYARQEGLADVFQRRRSRTSLIWPFLLLLLVGGLGGGFRGFVAATASFLFAWLFSLYLKKKIGGYTGDTLGAGCELTELVPPLVVSVTMGGA